MKIFDLGAGAFFRLQRIPLLRLEMCDRGRVALVFDNTDGIADRALDAYNAGGLVPAFDFGATLRQLKNSVYAEKEKSNGNYRYAPAR